MFLSRSGLELNGIWNRQVANLVEGDARLRELERRSHDSPEALERFHRELIRQGMGGRVMARLVRAHGDHHRRDPHSSETVSARFAVRNHYREHGDHPADHIRRREGESPGDFARRLRDITLTNSTVYPSMGGENDHGGITYDHDREDAEGHGRNAQRMRQAWEREVPEGYTAFHHKTGSDRDDIRGSVVIFRTGERPEPGSRRRR